LKEIALGTELLLLLLLLLLLGCGSTFKLIIL
jgi:hypothetical protein